MKVSRQCSGMIGLLELRRPHTSQVDVDGDSHQFSQPAEEPPNENTMQLRALSWIPYHIYQPAQKEAHIDLV